MLHLALFESFSSQCATDWWNKFEPAQKLKEKNSLKFKIVQNFFVAARTEQHFKCRALQSRDWNKFPKIESFFKFVFLRLGAATALNTILR